MSTAAIVAVVAAGLAYRAGGLTGLLVLAALTGTAYLQRDRLAALLRSGPHTHVRRLLGRPKAKHSHPADAGASALARARELRTPTVRLLTACRIITAAETEARRYQAGGEGERHAARLLAPLVAEGWVFLYDRRFPRGKANVDILAISPRGVVYNLDPKHWSARSRLWVDAGTRLMHGTRDVTHRLDGIKYETRSINSLLSVQAHSIVLMIGPLKRGMQLRVAGVRIIPAADACDVLRAIDAKQLPRQRGPQFVDLAARLLPAYTRK